MRAFVLMISLVAAVAAGVGRDVHAASATGARGAVRSPAPPGTGWAVYGRAARGGGQERPRSDKSSKQRGIIKEIINPTHEMNRASRLMRESRYGEAIPVLEMIAKGYPQILVAVEMLFECYVKAGRLQDAVDLLESKLKEHPDHFNFVRNLGYAYLDLGLKDKAIEAWERLLTGDERRAADYGKIAKIEQNAGLYEEAIETLRAGRRFKMHYERYTMEIIRLERILGRSRRAFREGIEYIASGREPTLEQAAFIFGVFREAGGSTDLLSGIDSLIAVGHGHGRFLRMLRTLLLVEAGMYVEAWNDLETMGGGSLSEKELSAFAGFLAGMEHKMDDDRFNAFFRRSMNFFLSRYGRSAVAPAVRFFMAERRRAGARRAAGGSGEEFEQAIALVDSVLHHPAGAHLHERASILKAEILLDDLHDPAGALETLDGARIRSRAEGLKAGLLRMQALLSLPRREYAEKRLSAMAGKPDSLIAIFGEYGLGRLSFLAGDYEDAVAELSRFAKRHAWNSLANDALETAMTVKVALIEKEEAALDLYRSALIDGERGDLAKAVDSLEALAVRHPDASLSPHAVYLKAGLEERAGMVDMARIDFARLAELFPLHELAPRALERLGALEERENPREAVERYRKIIERYPDDPFLERVRSRYIALRKSIENETNEGSGAR
jgi:tetratricopeptide (TPR) repeat protein